MIEIKKNGVNSYSFIIKAESDHTLLSSAKFSSKGEIKKTLTNLNSIKETQGVFERKTNHEGKFLFNLMNLDGELIGSSELYSSEAGMENGIKNLKNRIESLSNIGYL